LEGLVFFDSFPIFSTYDPLIAEKKFATWSKACLVF